MLKTALRLINNNHGFWQVAAPIIASVAGSAIGGLLNNKGQDDANAANAALWREQAAYNTPANQMKRYKEAGLNPYLAISGGNPGNMANIPEQKPVQRGEMFNNMFQNLGTIMQARNMSEQNKNLQEQNKLLHAQTAQTENATNMHTMDTLQRLEKMKMETKNIHAQSELNKLEKEIRARDNALNIKYNMHSADSHHKFGYTERKIKDYVPKAYNYLKSRYQVVHAPSGSTSSTASKLKERTFGDYIRDRWLPKR
jgi:hypothetical protein